MDNLIEIKICGFDEREIVKSVSFYIMRINRFNVYLTAVYTIMLIAAALSLSTVRYAPLAIVYLFCGIIFHYVYYIRPVDRYKKFYDKRKNTTYRFSDEFLESISQDVHSTVSWKVFKKAFNTPSAFLLLDDNKFLYIFPKKYFASDIEIEQLNALLADCIVDYKQYN